MLWLAMKGRGIDSIAYFYKWPVYYGHTDVRFYRRALEHVAEEGFLLRL
jgi:hypothetical protein